jgi:hypothetical protein
MIFNNLNDYLPAYERWKQTPARIINGEMFLRVNGVWVHSTEYDLCNSKPIYVPPRRENPDGKNIYGGVIAYKK